jgi:lipoprotein-anchoring transpeptidase ErfK/SrfK
MLCVRAATSGRLYCAAVISASIGISAGSPASAATYYWSDSEPAIVYPDRPAPPRRQKARHNQDKVPKTAEKELAKPQGPLILAVSINKQQVKVYDANGLFTQSSVSTGMKGHATPMGVFSVIQKQKFHRSNIYSNAPMPFMQRITWSGVAMHAGVLPGYPASHGCIRMPAGFAVRMYGLTRIGARVVITPGEVTPASFAHPLLAAFKAPEPTASVQPESTTPTTKTDKGAALDLRSTIGHDGAKPAADTVSASLREQTHTADASNVSRGPTTASDMPPGPPAASSAAKTDDDMAVPTKPGTSAPTAAINDSKPTDVPVAKSQESETKPADAAAQTDPVKTGTSTTETAPVDKPDDTKPAGITTADKPALPAKPELKRNSQVAIFISRKDGKLYVRQNLVPVFSTLVTIAPSDRPLGTHVFTASVDKTDANVVRWSVVSMPARSAIKIEDDERVSRRAKKSDVEAKTVAVPDSAAEALDRIAIPADVTAWLGEALSSGSSLIVSDQGINQGETGEGTEFILSLR